MRHQHVGVDVVKMILTSGSYLALAFAAWVLLRLVQACFYLPAALRRRDEEAERQRLLEAAALRGDADAGAGDAPPPEDEPEPEPSTSVSDESKKDI